MIGATNEPPGIPTLRWFELGVMDWVFAVSPRHPLAGIDQRLNREMIALHRAVVVVDSSRSGRGRPYRLVASIARTTPDGAQGQDWQ